jgi:hypothetical protein
MKTKFVRQVFFWTGVAGVSVIANLAFQRAEFQRPNSAAGRLAALASGRAA